MHLVHRLKVGQRLALAFAITAAVFLAALTVGWVRPRASAKSVTLRRASGLSTMRASNCTLVGSARARRLRAMRSASARPSPRAVGS